MWRLGVPHTDMSFFNWKLTSYEDGDPCAIITDLSQSSIMSPMAESPGRTGFQRAGARLFVAEQLANYSDGSVARRYHHDLESILWSMVWYVDGVNAWGYSLDIPYSRRRWADDHRDKTEANAGIRPGTAALWLKIVAIAVQWGMELVLRRASLENTWIDLISKHLVPPEEIGTSWATFEIAEQDIRAQDIFR